MKQIIDKLKNFKLLGYVLFLLAFSWFLVKVGPPSLPRVVNSSNRFDDSEILKLKPLPRNGFNGNSNLPFSEIEKFLTGTGIQNSSSKGSYSYDAKTNSNFQESIIYGTGVLMFSNKTNWDIDSIRILFSIKYLNGSTRSIVLINEMMVPIKDLERSVFFNVRSEDMLNYFSDVKEFNWRVVDACGKIRPMKIEIKAKEAVKKAGESMNKVIKGIDDLFSR